MLPVLAGTGTSVSVGKSGGRSPAISQAAIPISSPRLSAYAIRRVSASSGVIGRDLGDTYLLAARMGGTRTALGTSLSRTPKLLLKKLSEMPAFAR